MISDAPVQSVLEARSQSLLTATSADLIGLELCDNEPPRTTDDVAKRPAPPPTRSLFKPPTTSAYTNNAGGMTRLPGSHGEHLLQCAYGTQHRAKRFYGDQVLDHLNPAMVEFAQRMEMIFIATADSRGDCDASLRAGPPGFIQVLNSWEIAYPEYRGNGVMASLGNISENPHVGLLMIDFVTDLIGLHINGKARVVEDNELRRRHPALPVDHERGRRPERWVTVEVEEAYIHCRKHIPRLVPVVRERAWGTDDLRRKGGDYFGAKATATAGVRTS